MTRRAGQMTPKTYRAHKAGLTLERLGLEIDGGRTLGGDWWALVGCDDGIFRLVRGETVGQVVQQAAAMVDQEGRDVWRAIDWWIRARASIGPWRKGHDRPDTPAS